MNLKLRIPGNSFEKVMVPIASGVTVEVGDLISYESATGVKLDTATEDATFVGVSEHKSIDGQTDDISVSLEGLYEGAVESASYNVGDALGYNASNDTLEASTANTIAWSAEKKASATTLKVFIDIKALGKFFTVNS